jgi:hypothetical protein
MSPIKTIPRLWGRWYAEQKTSAGKSDFVIFFDKGYHTETEFDYAHKLKRRIFKLNLGSNEGLTRLFRRIAVSRKHTEIKE